MPHEERTRGGRGIGLGEDSTFQPVSRTVLRRNLDPSSAVLLSACPVVERAASASACCSRCGFRVLFAPLCAAAHSAPLGCRSTIRPVIGHRCGRRTRTHSRHTRPTGADIESPLSMYAAATRAARDHATRTAARMSAMECGRMEGVRRVASCAATRVAAAGVGADSNAAVTFAQRRIHSSARLRSAAADTPLASTQAPSKFNSSLVSAVEVPREAAIVIVGGGVIGCSIASDTQHARRTRELSTDQHLSCSFAH